MLGLVDFELLIVCVTYFFRCFNFLDRIYGMIMSSLQPVGDFLISFTGSYLIRVRWLIIQVYIGCYWAIGYFKGHLPPP